MKAVHLKIVGGEGEGGGRNADPDPNAAAQAAQSTTAARAELARRADALAAEAGSPSPTFPKPEQIELAYAPADLARRADAYAASERAKNTRRAYRAGWEHFAAWCQAASLPPLPATADTIRFYLAAHGGNDGEAMLKVKTLQQRLAAITFYHRENGYEPQTRTDAVRRVLEGIVRTHAEEGIVTRKATPILIPDMRRLIEALPLEGTAALWPLRDRALLLLGWAGGFRRSALKALNLADIEEAEAGLIITIRRDKTDQKGRGRAIGIRYGAEEALCPVRAYQAWIEALAEVGIRQGAIFREITRHHKVEGRISDRGVARIIQRAVYRAGYDPEGYSGHSLRRGLITAARRAGADRLDIANTTGHKSMSVLDGYVEQGDLFDNTPASKAGL